MKCRRCSFPRKNASWLWLSLASRSCCVHVVAARSVCGENGGIRQCRWRHLFMQELWAHMALVRPFQDTTDVWCRLPFFFQVLWHQRYCDSSTCLELSTLQDPRILGTKKCSCVPLCILSGKTNKTKTCRCWGEGVAILYWRQTVAGTALAIQPNRVATTCWTVSQRGWWMSRLCRFVIG